MGLLDDPVNPIIAPADRIAEGMRQRARVTYRQLVQLFNQSAKSFWRNPGVKPSDIAAALGTDAKEVFELHGKIGALLASVKPESIAEGAAVVGEFTYNQDGTVSVVDPTPNPPTPQPAN